MPVAIGLVSDAPVCEFGLSVVALSCLCCGGRPVTVGALHAGMACEYIPGPMLTAGVRFDSRIAIAPIQLRS
jgi:hypothetical protein